MKVKVNAEIHLDIPGEFQNDELAVRLIKETLHDMLYVGLEYDQDDLPEDFLPIRELHIRSYHVLSGRVTQQDIDKALEIQRSRS
jgi:hypothetical protein